MIALFDMGGALSAQMDLAFFVVNMKRKKWQNLNLNTSLVAPGALAHRLQRSTACNAAEANLHSPNQKTEVTSL